MGTKGLMLEARCQSLKGVKGSIRKGTDRLQAQCPMCEIITAVFNRFPLVPKDKPEASKPEVSKPEVSKPEVSKPEASKPEVKTSKSSTASSTTKDSEVSSIPNIVCSTHQVHVSSHLKKIIDQAWLAHIVGHCHVVG